MRQGLQFMGFWPLAFVAASVPVQAQTATSRGQTIDESGAVIPGAKVTLNGPSGLVKSGMSANDGSFSFTGLTPDDYSVHASAPDLALSQPVRIHLKAGVQTLNLEVLQLENGASDTVSGWGLAASLFRKRQFAAEIIVTCVRWCLRFSLSLRDVEEPYGRAGLISRPHHGVALDTDMPPRCSTDCEDRSSRKDRPGTWMRLLCESPAVGCTCSVPSTAAGKTVDFYLSETRDREAAKCFLRRALANPDNRAPHLFARDWLRSYPAAIRELQNEGQLRRSCQHRTRRYSNKSHRIRPPPHQTAIAEYARTADLNDGLRGNCWDPGGANDS
jgi:transposase, IS6 family